MSSRIDTHYTPVDKPLFFIDSQKTVFEQLELSTSDVVKLIFSTKVVFEQLTDVFVTEFR